MPIFISRCSPLYLYDSTVKERYIRPYWLSIKGNHPNHPDPLRPSLHHPSRHQTYLLHPSLHRLKTHRQNHRDRAVHPVDCEKRTCTSPGALSCRWSRRLWGLCMVRGTASRTRGHICLCIRLAYIQSCASYALRKGKMMAGTYKSYGRSRFS